MPAELLRKWGENFTDAMGAAERYSIGLNERAKRLKQAMFPQESQPGEPMPKSDFGATEAAQEAGQQAIENATRKKYRR